MSLGLTSGDSTEYSDRMSNFVKILCLCAVAVLAGCTEQPQNTPGAPAPRILTMGDSLLAWNSSSGASVSHAIEDGLQEEVVDRSVPGAQVIYGLPITGALGLNISKQYISGDWDWVVLNGGGNDLLLGCGCNGCAARMNRMIGSDGASGAIPGLVSKLRSAGARVLYVGYLRTPGTKSPVDRCGADGAELEQRVARMARQRSGVYFLPMGDLVPNNDRSFHDVDRIHPSRKGSTAIGQRVAQFIKSKDKMRALR